MRPRLHARFVPFQPRSFDLVSPFFALIVPREPARQLSAKPPSPPLRSGSACVGRAPTRVPTSLRRGKTPVLKTKTPNHATRKEHDQWKDTLTQRPTFPSGQLC